MLLESQKDRRKSVIQKKCLKKQWLKSSQFNQRIDPRYSRTQNKVCSKQNKTQRNSCPDPSLSKHRKINTKNLKELPGEMTLTYKRRMSQTTGLSHEKP